MSNPESPDPRTRWSRIEALSGDEIDQAWGWFQDRYTPFVRRVLSGRFTRALDLDELVSGFWGYLFEADRSKRYFDRVDRKRRFRAFLFTTIVNYASAQGRKLAGHREVRSDPDLISCEPQEFADQMMRDWAISVLHNALETLRQEDKSDVNWLPLCLYYGLPTFDSDEPVALGYEAIAERLGMKASALPQRMLRCRRRLRMYVEREILDTVENREDVDEELDHVFAAVCLKWPELLVPPSVDG